MHLISLPYGSATFCDDIRQETGNKISLIGIYQQDMLLPTGTTFPAMLPKLGVAVAWYEAANKTHEEALFKIGMRRFDTLPDSDDDHPVGEMRVDLRDARKAGIPPEMQGSATLRGQMFPMTIISPCFLPFAGLLRVRAFIGGEIWGLGGIKINVAQAALTD